MSDRYAMAGPHEWIDNPPLGDNPQHPTVRCDDPIDFYPPFGERAIPLKCVLGKSHTNDHLSIFGSGDHKPPVSIEVRWSQR